MNMQERDGERNLRKTILRTLKERGEVTIADVAARTGVTYEAIRQQMATLQEEGWVTSRRRPSEARETGRPTRLYSLSAAGEHLFPKEYDALGIELIETLHDQLGIDALRTLLGALTEARVRRWEPLLAGKSLEERIEMLKDLYLADDPFMEVERRPDGLRLIERNCPFFNIASAHPALCSVSVSVLTRLLGVKVLREERFQSGDRRCVFRILADTPVVPAVFGFEFEQAI
jgi:predicted ArsR family transcriptional regulator